MDTITWSAIAAGAVWTLRKTRAKKRPPRRPAPLRTYPSGRPRPSGR